MKLSPFQQAFRYLLALILAIGTTVVFSSPVVLAVGEPTVTWTTANGSTFSGTAVIDATASATSGYVKKWCVTKDGVALTTNSAKSDSSLYSGTFNSSTGCWSVSYSYASLTTGNLSFDTTAWADGSYKYEITVTDSNNRTTTSSVLTIKTVNAGPTVSWTTKTGTSFSGTATGPHDSQ